MNDDSPEKPTILNNANCSYCGIQLDAVNSTRDHVIAKSFVPRGKLNNHWNLIVQACKGCNETKGDLEDDLGAITMQPDAWGRYAIDDATLIAEANRKGRGSRSRKTAKRVQDSSESLKLRTALGNASMSFGMVCGPQPADERVIALSQMHSMAFFYFVTFEENIRLGRSLPGKFLPVEWRFRADWGNPIQLAFANSVLSWQTRLCCITAEGFFKTAIRKHPTEMCWSWAYEWNHNLRIIGFFGELSPARAVAETFPDRPKHIVRNRNEVFRFTEEVPLSSESDVLFSAGNF